MITINLSERQARLLLVGLGYRENNEVTASLKVARSVCDELFTQIEQQLMPRSTSAAELAVWRHENGLNEMDVEKWKRKHETMTAFDIACELGKESNKI